MNLLIGIALVAVFALMFWKFTLPGIRANFRQVAEFKRKYGATKLVALWTGVATYIALGAWLSLTATWPGICDHEGHRLMGMLKSLHCSPDLLSGGGKEIGLFFWLWSMPATVLGALIYGLIRKARNTKFSLYSDDTE